VTVTESRNPGERQAQDSGDFWARHVTAGQYEGADPAADEGGELRIGEADPGILCQDRPAPVPHDGQPNVVRSVLGEVVIVSMDLDAQRAQRVGDDVSSE
jgi:hypothetical protein